MTPRKSPQAPPFCPNSRCTFHCGDTTSWRCVKKGFFASARSGTSTQRYKCRDCGRSFSTRTFRSTYRLRRADLFFRVARGLVSCSGYRQLAAGLGVSHSTIARHAAKLGRQALLAHESFRSKRTLAEPLALDSFVSFVYSQYYPVHFHLTIGRESHFVYGFTESEVRRSGTMTRGQRARREALEQKLGRPDPKAREKDVAAILEIVGERVDKIDLTTDEDQAYPRAIRRSQLNVTHATISSRALRTTSNPLFASNLFDLQVRHAGSNHKRETIGFSKTMRGVIERMWLTIAWKNYVKPFSETEAGTTPAQRAGLTTEKWSFRQLLRRRRFPGREVLPVRWRAHFDGTTPTRAYGGTEKTVLVYGY
jgi:transposase-like protein